MEVVDEELAQVVAGGRQHGGLHVGQDRSFLAGHGPDLDVRRRHPVVALGGTSSLKKVLTGGMVASTGRLEAAFTERTMARRLGTVKQIVSSRSSFRHSVCVQSLVPYMISV